MDIWTYCSHLTLFQFAVYQCEMTAFKPWIQKDPRIPIVEAKQSKVRGPFDKGGPNVIPFLVQLLQRTPKRSTNQMSNIVK